ncbi:hypothetical protein [Thioclava sp. GXIMD4215]|uniref:hypothetical protein n=1 Tax=Thioclava sp. GXIMD4215 TaxID=3131928 RepID=UPI00324F3B11
MSNKFEINPDEHYQCIDLNTEKGHACTFRYEDKDIRVRVHSFAEKPELNAEEVIFLLSEKMKKISLFNNVDLGTPRVFGLDDQIYYCQNILSNCAVIGDEIWPSDQKIKRILFRLPKSDILFRHSEKLSALASGDIEEKHFNLLDVKTRNLNVKIGYTAKGNAYGGGWTSTGCIFDIELDNPVKMGDHLTYQNDINCFFSGCLGVLIIEDEQCISPDSSAELDARLKQRKTARIYRELRLKNPKDITDFEGNFHGSPAWGVSDTELSNTARCLKAWIERADDWRNAYLHMQNCLRQRSEVSAERLISACRWLENIPTAKFEKVINDSNLENIASYAREKSEELHLDIPLKRLTGCLSSLKKETHEQRFSRLISELPRSGLTKKPSATFVEDLKKSQSLRGAAAHSHVDAKTPEAFNDFYRALLSLEALCFLLTMNELPWTDEAKRRLQGHPLIQNYNHAP